MEIAVGVADPDPARAPVRGREGGQHLHVPGLGEGGAQGLGVGEGEVGRGPLGVSLGLKAVYRGLATTVEEGQKIEADLVGYAFASEDIQEGFRAFLEKRPAQFKGR